MPSRYYNSRYSYDQDDECSGKVCWCVGYANAIPWLAICGISLVIFIPVGIYVGLKVDPETFSPMETRTVQVRDGTFCGGLTLNVTSKTTSATLYRLSQEPRISTDDNGYQTLPLNNVVLFPKTYSSWRFHLLPGSNVSINLCITQGSGLNIYVFRGDNFNRWVNNSLSFVSSFASLIISDVGGNCPYVFDDSVMQEDDWYYVLYSTSSNVYYNGNVSLLRTVHVVENVVQSCSAGGSHGQECTVPNDRDSWYVVATGNGSLLDYQSGLPVQVNCQLAGGPIAGIVIGVLIPYLIFCAAVLGAIWWCGWHIDRNERTSSSRVRTPKLASDSPTNCNADSDFRALGEYPTQT
jgi:hypothetical protein